MGATRDILAARSCLVDRALHKYERKGLARFDSATYFAKYQPSKCTTDATGNLRKLRPRPTETPHGANQDRAKGAESGPQRPSGRGNGLKVLAELYAGSWALELTGNPEFSESVASGLTRLATLCGSSVRSQEQEGKGDPWKLTATLSDSERRAMAALVAELLLREMQTIADHKERVNMQIKREALGVPGYPGTPIPTRRRGLLPHPPMSRKSAVSARPMSMRAQHQVNVLAAAREAGCLASIPSSPVGSCSDWSATSAASSPATSPVRPGAAVVPPHEMPLLAGERLEEELGGALFLPPSKEFWVSLASSGVSPSRESSFKILNTEAPSIGGAPASASNSISTA